jgi:hypothetical protein
MIANAAGRGLGVELAGDEARLPRWAVLFVGAILALLLGPATASAAKVDPCPLPGCSDKVAPTCGMCSTINGNYAVYYIQPGGQ